MQPVAAPTSEDVRSTPDRIDSDAINSIQSCQRSTEAARRVRPATPSPQVRGSPPSMPIEKGLPRLREFASGETSDSIGRTEPRQLARKRLEILYPTFHRMSPLTSKQVGARSIRTKSCDSRGSPRIPQKNGLTPRIRRKIRPTNVQRKSRWGGRAPALARRSSDRWPQWRRSGSNRQPPACKAGALPIELRPRYCAGPVPARAAPFGRVPSEKRAARNSTPRRGGGADRRPNSREKWARQDSNLGPQPYQGCALTN